MNRFIWMSSFDLARKKKGQKFKNGTESGEQPRMRKKWIDKNDKRMAKHCDYKCACLVIG
jgi:hypothetical protein